MNTNASIRFFDEQFQIFADSIEYNFHRRIDHMLLASQEFSHSITADAISVSKKRVCLAFGFESLRK